MNEKFYWYKRGREDKLEARREKMKNYPEDKQKKILRWLNVCQCMCLLGLYLIFAYKKTLFKQPPLYLFLLLFVVFLSISIEQWVRSIYGEDEKIMRPFTYVQGGIRAGILFSIITII